jgi:hypothetical protein
MLDSPMSSPQMTTMLGWWESALASNAGANAAARKTAVATSIENWEYLIFLPPSETLRASEKSFSPLLN